MSLAMNAQQIETPFAYPQAPDTLSTLEDRTSYVIMKFWDNCDFKKVMPDTAKFNRAFRDYISFVPYAYTDSIRKSANALLNRFKDNPKAILQIAISSVPKPRSGATKCSSCLHVRYLPIKR